MIFFYNNIDFLLIAKLNVFINHYQFSDFLRKKFFLNFKFNSELTSYHVSLQSFFAELFSINHNTFLEINFDLSYKIDPQIPLLLTNPLYRLYLAITAKDKFNKDFYKDEEFALINIFDTYKEKILKLEIRSVQKDSSNQSNKLGYIFHEIAKDFISDSTNETEASYNIRKILDRLS